MKWKNKSWITLWLILVCVALAITGTYAAYTNVEYLKRVVASKAASETFLFSSNYLFLRDTSENVYPLRIIPVGTETDASVTVTICNYLQSDLTKVNGETISYTLHAQLVDLNNQPINADTEIVYQGADGSTSTVAGSELAQKIKISITRSDSTGIKQIAFDEDCSLSSDETLVGETAQTVFYQITCAQDDVPILNAIAIRMWAIPTGNTGKGLFGQLSLGSGFQRATPWSGSFTGLRENDNTPLDAFNYVISGTVKQTMWLSWDESQVILGKWSLEQLKNPTIEGIEGRDWKYIAIDVGSADAPSSYTLQFYRVNGALKDETKAGVESCVAFRDTPPPYG